VMLFRIQGLKGRDVVPTIVSYQTFQRYDVPSSSVVKQSFSALGITFEKTQIPYILCHIEYVKWNMLERT
jgi:hypothetical protein